MFAPDNIPSRAAALRSVDRTRKASSGRSVVGAAPGGGSGKKRRSRLGTLAKSTVEGRTPGGQSRFCKRTRFSGRRKRVPTREDEKSVRLRRFALQSVSAGILRDCKKRDGKPMFRVASCLRSIIPVKKTVGLQYVPKKKSSHYTGLQVCSSVWICPCCAAKISERRREELARLIKKHIEAGGCVYLATYTVSHQRYDDLGDLLKRFLEARSDMTGTQKWRKKVKPMFGIIGTVSVLEVTWSKANGWHPHVHELIFTDKEIDVDAYDKMVRETWEHEAGRQGLGMNKHGFKIDRTFGAVQDYITKFGTDPATDRPWGVEAEVVKGHLKQGRTTEHYTPFALLAAIHDDNRDDLKPIFQEYALWFKGHKQLNYSPGLKARYAEEEKSDEELALESEGNEPITLVELEKKQWAGVVGNDIRGELLEAVRTGSPGVVINYLAEFNIEASPAPLSGLRVQTPQGTGVISFVTKCTILNRWRCSVILDEELIDGSTFGAFNLEQVVVIEMKKSG